MLLELIDSLSDVNEAVTSSYDGGGSSALVSKHLFDLHATQLTARLIAPDEISLNAKRNGC